MVEIIPVLDIRGGEAVSGKSGDRERYRPLKTVFASGSDPVEIAGALPFERLYVADLDGIVLGGPDIETLTKLSKENKLMVDIGVRSPEDLAIFENLPCEIILGTETMESIEVVVEALRLYGAGRVIVSIDIKEGRVLSSFLSTDPVFAYDSLSRLGVGTAIFLNISAVGTGRADNSFIKDLNKTGQIFLGGGLSKDDINRLDSLIVDGILIGTALHKGLLDVS